MKKFHMMAVLVDTTGPQGTKIIPVETTGLSYNSYFTPEKPNPNKKAYLCSNTRKLTVLIIIDRLFRSAMQPR